MKQFPFTAIRGQQAMQAALLAAAIDPQIGGVLIRGQKGTAKSTTVRSLTSLLPLIEVVSGCPYHCRPDEPDTMHDSCRRKYDAGEVLSRELRPTPFVDLPLSATEDRLVGTLHLEKTLQSGTRHFDPGLLARANRGILYVDEVNLLPDHLVDLLLDVASSGLNQIEREGICYNHPASFILVGSMNPEEGELRPQFLDRFGLCVSVTGLADAALRRKIVLDHLAFEQDADDFLNSFADQEALLRQQVVLARDRLPKVLVPEPVIDLAVQLATLAKAQGHRAELAMVRTARALAAFCDRTEVIRQDLVEAARFALPHRLDDNLGTNPEDSAVRIEQLVTESAAGLAAAESGEAPVNPAEDMFIDNMDFPGSAAAGSMLFTYLKKKSMTATSLPMRPSM